MTVLDQYLIRDIEVGECIGKSFDFSFYRIKNDSNKGIKLANIKYKNLAILEQIFKKEKRFQEKLLHLNISTPNVFEIVKIRHPSLDIDTLGLIVEIIDDSKIFKISFDGINYGNKKFLIEEISLCYVPHINFIDSKSEIELDTSFILKVKNCVLANLNVLIENDSFSKEYFKTDLDVQGLYVESKNEFYLFDFEDWRE